MPGDRRITKGQAIVTQLVNRSAKAQRSFSSLTSSMSPQSARPLPVKCTIDEVQMGLAHRQIAANNLNSVDPSL